MTLAGASFCLRGYLDDETATVSATLAGDTNSYGGFVERDGRFWLENLPLQAGTNSLAITATDAAGNSATTNLTLLGSPLALTMDPVPVSSMHQVEVSASGTVSDPACSLTVNGVAASMDGTNWAAANVPVNAGGVATFRLTPTAGTNEPPVELTLDADKPPVVYVQQYSLIYTSWVRGVHTPTGELAETLSSAWLHRNHAKYDYAYTLGYHGVVQDCGSQSTWPADGWPTLLAGTEVVHCAGAEPGTNATEQFTPPIERCDLRGTFEQSGSVTPGQYRRTAESVVKLFTGGKARSQRQRLFALTGQLQPAKFAWSWAGGGMAGDGLVPGEATIWGDLGRADADYTAWRVLGDGQTVDVTPRTGEPALTLAELAAAGPTDQGVINPTLANAGAVPSGPRIWFQGTDITGKTNTVLVGQRLSLTCTFLSPPGVPPKPITNHLWIVPGTAISNQYVSPDLLTTNGYPVPLTAISNATLHFCWVDGGRKDVRCTVNVLGEPVTVETTFLVKVPKAKLEASYVQSVIVDENKLMFGSHTFPGISFMAREKDTPGSWEFIQLGHQLFRYQNAEDGKWGRKEGSGLDGPYPSLSGQDKPYTELPLGCLQATADGSFTTYLAFRPTPSDVLVPIREIRWSWAGVAIYTNAAWALASGTNHVDNSDRPAPSTISWSDRIQRTLDTPIIEP